MWSRIKVYFKWRVAPSYPPDLWCLLLPSVDWEPKISWLWVGIDIWFIFQDWGGRIVFDDLSITSNTYVWDTFWTKKCVYIAWRLEKKQALEPPMRFWYSGGAKAVCVQFACKRSARLCHLLKILRWKHLVGLTPTCPSLEVSSGFLYCGSIVERIGEAINRQRSRLPLDIRPVGRWINVPLGRKFILFAFCNAFSWGSQSLSLWKMETDGESSQHRWRTTPGFACWVKMEIFVAAWHFHLSSQRDCGSGRSECSYELFGDGLWGSFYE
jgi:hypothetical protein